MINQYLSQTQALLQNPPSSPPLYSTALLTGFINTARSQVATESKSIRFMGSLSINSGSMAYPFSSISLTGASGVAGVMAVRSAWYVSGSGQIWIAPRPFEWFSLYDLNSSPPPTGAPVEWSQFGQGSQPVPSTTIVGGGSLYVSPLPNAAYTLKLDCVCFPIPLADDTTVESLPYQWTDAVPYFAAYLALMSSQTGARMAQAENLLKLYELFVQRAAGASVPDVMPGIYSQARGLAESAQTPPARQTR